MPQTTATTNDSDTTTTDTTTSTTSTNITTATATATSTATASSGSTATTTITVTVTATAGTQVAVFASFSAGSHVAVFAFPFSSHAAILLPVVHRLAHSSPATIFSFFSTPRSKKTLSSMCEHYLSQPNVRAFDVSDGVPEGYVFTGRHEEDIELFMNAGPVNLRKAVDTAVVETGRKVTCLVTDAFLWFAADIAEELHVPWVACWASGLNSLSAHVYTDLIRERIGIEGIEERLDEKLEFIPGMSKVQVRDLPEGVVPGNRQSLFSNMLHQMGRKLTQADAVFLNCFEELDLTITNDLKSKFKKFLNVGPFTLLSPPPPAKGPDTNGCLSWLAEKQAASVAYVSFGTAAKLPPGEVVAIAEALEAGNVPFIWSLQDNFQEDLPSGFKERTRAHGIVVPWAPQVDILKHKAIGVLITHCGWNSMLESIVGGVPMICRPFFGDHSLFVGDHRLNGRMIESVWEIGVNVEDGKFTKDGLTERLDLVLRQEEGKKMRERIRKAKEDLINAIGPKGSSMENLQVLLDIVSKS